MLTTFWNEFLQFVEKHESKNSILLSILHLTQPAELTEETLVLRCENQGMKMWLDKKKKPLEQYLATHLKKKVNTVFIIAPSKKKEEPPLLRFQPAKEDLFSKAGLHAKYTFDNFAVSSSNQVAFAAAQAVAK